MHETSKFGEYNRISFSQPNRCCKDSKNASSIIIIYFKDFCIILYE